MFGFVLDRSTTSGTGTGTNTRRSPPREILRRAPALVSASSNVTPTTERILTMSTESKNLPVTIDEQLSSSTVLAYLADPASVQIQAFQQDPEEIRKRIEEQLLGATSLDELLGEREVIQGKSYVGKPFYLQSVEWRQSDYETEFGLPFYAVMQISDYDGNMHTLSCGARSVVQKAAIMADRGWLPAWVKITEGKQTEAGYKPLDLTSAPAPF